MSAGDEETDLARRAFEARRRRDALALLPLLGIFLFLSPILGIFSIEASVLGVPVIFLFVYGAWAALIVLARWLTRRADPGDEGRQ